MRFNATMREVAELMDCEEKGSTREEAFEKVWGDMAPQIEPWQIVSLDVIDLPKGWRKE